MADFPGSVRLVYKDFPLDFHRGARPAALGARCAAAACAFWPYHDLLFLSQPAFAREDLVGYARRLRLDEQAFAACLDGGRFQDALETDVREGRALGVTGTPTFFVNGRRHYGAYDVESLSEAVKVAKVRALL